MNNHTPGRARQLLRALVVVVTKELAVVQECVPSYFSRTIHAVFYFFNLAIASFLSWFTAPSL